MKKVFFIWVFSMLYVVNANAFKVGDEITEEVAAKLQLGDGVTIVDFFASWCISCKKELPLINELSEKTDVNKLKYVGIDTDEDINEGLIFQKELGLKFFVFNDKKQEIVEKFNPIGMPALYYIKDRKVLKIRFGAIENIGEVIKKDIEAL